MKHKRQNRSIAIPGFSPIFFTSPSNRALQVILGLPLPLLPATSKFLQALTQSSTSFRSTCPNQSSEMYHRWSIKANQVFCVLQHLEMASYRYFGTRKLNHESEVVELLICDMHESCCRTSCSAICNATSKRLGLHGTFLSWFQSVYRDEETDVSSHDPDPDHPPKQPKVKSTAFLGIAGLGQFCTVNT